MLNLAGSLRVFVCTQPADMRRSFDGLCGMVQQLVAEDPLSGHLFVFRNRLRDRLKILYWDRDGLAIWYKRLEAGTFRFPAATDEGTSVEVRPSDLAMLLDGVDLASVRRRKRYRRTA
jgi:transposase